MHESTIERIAFSHFTHIVSKADYVITLHGSGNIEATGPKVIYEEHPRELGTRTLELAKAFGLHILQKGIACMF